ncbi:hypothetical protein DFH06DRAFT_610911 [Mycena polygramma]|nr:hypothetical protein DFH06DRAFT_610911 [Mycena polygramma]
MQEQFWEDNNPAIKYSPGQWARSYSSIYHGSAVMRTRQLGDSISVTFKGSSVKFMGAQGGDHGSFLVNLDGEETIVDGYCCGPNAGVPQVIQFEATGLSTTEHVLNITNHAAGPWGTVFEVDALLVTPHPGGSYLGLAVLLVFLAFLVVGIRRRFVRVANQASYQLLPQASHGASNSARISPPPAAPPFKTGVRPDKGAPQADSDEIYASGGASGSGATLPPYYAPATAGAQQGEDELVERIAQRLARLVQNDAPPMYETTAT